MANIYFYFKQEKDAKNVEKILEEVSMFIPVRHFGINKKERKVYKYDLKVEVPLIFKKIFFELAYKFLLPLTREGKLFIKEIQNKDVILNQDVFKEISNGLWDYQQNSLNKLITFLELYKSAMLVSDVGTGKTWIIGRAFKYYDTINNNSFKMIYFAPKSFLMDGVSKLKEVLFIDESQIFTPQKGRKTEINYLIEDIQNTESKILLFSYENLSSLKVNKNRNFKKFKDLFKKNIINKYPKEDIRKFIARYLFKVLDIKEVADFLRDIYLYDDSTKVEKILEESNKFRWNLVDFLLENYDNNLDLLMKDSLKFIENLLHYKYKGNYKNFERSINRIKIVKELLRIPKKERLFNDLSKITFERITKFLKKIEESFNELINITPLFIILKEKGYNFVVLDEVHRVNNMKSKRDRRLLILSLVYRLLKNDKKVYIIGSTATPVDKGDLQKIVAYFEILFYRPLKSKDNSLPLILKVIFNIFGENEDSLEDLEVKDRFNDKLKYHLSKLKKNSNLKFLKPEEISQAIINFFDNIKYIEEIYYENATKKIKELTSKYRKDAPGVYTFFRGTLIKALNRIKNLTTLFLLLNEYVVYIDLTFEDRGFLISQEEVKVRYLQTNSIILTENIKQVLLDSIENLYNEKQEILHKKLKNIKKNLTEAIRKELETLINDKFLEEIIDKITDKLYNHLKKVSVFINYVSPSFLIRDKNLSKVFIKFMLKKKKSSLKKEIINSLEFKLKRHLKNDEDEILDRFYLNNKLIGFIIFNLVFEIVYPLEQGIIIPNYKKIEEFGDFAGLTLEEKGILVNNISKFSELLFKETKGNVLMKLLKELKGKVVIYTPYVLQRELSVKLIKETFPDIKLKVVDDISKVNNLKEKDIIFMKNSNTEGFDLKEFDNIIFLGIPPNTEYKNVYQAIGRLTRGIVSRKNIKVFYIINPLNTLEYFLKDNHFEAKKIGIKDSKEIMKKYYEIINNFFNINFERKLNKKRGGAQ